MENKIISLRQKSEAFIMQHSSCVFPHQTIKLNGEFSLFRGLTTPDLYGMVDAVYSLYTLGLLYTKTDKNSREEWALKILACQDDTGWFTKQNNRGHSKEHATAYALGALILLEKDSGENYLDNVKPIKSLLPLITDSKIFHQFIQRLDFNFSIFDIYSKKLGWHYIWRGSHVGGGLAAIIGMTEKLYEQWWPGKNNVDEWFLWYFDWLDNNVNPLTGYWQRAFWNFVYRKPLLVDMGGAVHFYWIYNAWGRLFPYPEALIESTLKLQRTDGLYKEHPFCIDLDGNFCLIRSYLQLPDEKKPNYSERVYTAAERNFKAIVNFLTEKQFTEVYRDSHGLPGALAALVECTKLPGFIYSGELAGWQHPLDRVWWL
jgi:hypothetical protein